MSSRFEVREMGRRASLKKIAFGLSVLPGLGFLRAGRELVSLEKTKTQATHEASPSTYQRIKTYLNNVHSIDTHEHLRAFKELLYVETAQGRGVNLYALWKNSYLSRISSVTPWKSGTPFEEWWAEARNDFLDVRASDFYRYLALAFHDLYGVDFDRITTSEARRLNERVFENYRNPKWLYRVITEKANIELIVCDRYWKRFDFHADYPFEFVTLNVTPLVWGFHPSEFHTGMHDGQIQSSYDDPYLYARRRSLPLNSLDDYLGLLDHLFAEAKAQDAVCLKTTLAYVRTLHFDDVPTEKAAKVFGRNRSELAPQEIKQFEDFIMWRLAELSAKHEMPFQIHTGDARIQGSNPMLLVNLIDANSKTKFVLFHGGFPWVGETAAIGMKYSRNVWINGVWLPTISYTTAKRAFHEWLDVVPSNHITWGGDDTDAEGIYGETELNRRCWAEVLAERVDHDDLLEEDARRIGKQILRDNALDLYPKLKTKLWRDKQKRLRPANFRSSRANNLRDYSAKGSEHATTGGQSS